MKTELTEELAAALLVLRRLKDWSQQELAEASGVNRTMISLFETGLRRPSERSLRRLLAALAVPASTFQALLSDLRLAATGQDVRARDGGEPGEGTTLSMRAALRSAEAEILAALSVRPPDSPESARRKAQESWARLKSFSPNDQRLLVKGALEYQSWALCELVCRESQQVAASDPPLSIELAELALWIADRVAGEESLRAQLQAYAFSHRGNARRVADDAVGAEADFRRARELRLAAASGTPVWWDQGLALDLEASLRKDQRRFGEAVALHEQALTAAGPERLGDILLNFASTLEQMGEVGRSVEVLREAARHVDAHRSPRSLLVLRFNLVVNLIHLNRLSEAAALLPEVRELAVHLRNELDLLRVRWLESRILAGQGKRAEAVEGLCEVAAGFLARNLAYEAALASLELAVPYLEDNRTAEVKELAERMTPIFTAQGIGREALASLQLFYDAAKREAATVELARRVHAEMERARRAG